MSVASTASLAEVDQKQVCSINGTVHGTGLLPDHMIPGELEVHEEEENEELGLDVEDSPTTVVVEGADQVEGSQGDGWKEHRAKTV